MTWTGQPGWRWRRLAPVFFVFLWSTGFIGAKYGLPSAEPFTFLALRMAIAVTLLAPVCVALRIRWPKNWRVVAHLSVVGALVHGAYLGGVFAAIHRGVPAGFSAIIVGLQPIVTAVFAAVWLGERLTNRKITGLVVGLAGIVLVVQGRPMATTGLDLTGLAWLLAALAGISIGTLYQKRFCVGENLLGSVLIQYTANALLMALLAFTLEQRDIVWTPEFAAALAWLILGLSFAAVLLLMYLIRHGEAGGVASLFYLVPPLTVLEAYFLFGERLHALAILGMVCCVLAVYLVLNERTGHADAVT